MSFMMITDSQGYEWIVSRDHVVVLEPLGRNEWHKGALLYLEKDSCSRNQFELDYDGAMAVREWLLKA